MVINRISDIPVMDPVINHTDQKEEHGGDGAMVEHLEDGALDRSLVENRHSEQHITHMTDT